ncbi:MAG: sigma-70 family RNA polymerase sigma factor [Deltaproteobacteria bacterium]|nr:sigma-70 family RNA polymerase sigma factor [Deltaproteobacteria bacterium]
MTKKKKNPRLANGPNVEDEILKVAQEKAQSNDYNHSRLSVQEVNRIIVEIYTKYNTGLQNYVRNRLSRKEDTNDIVQDVYLRLIQNPKLDTLKPSLELLCTIAANIMKDRYRRESVRKQDKHIPLDDIELASPPASPEQILRSKEGAAGFSQVIESLNPKCRRAFSLHRFKGLTYNEIAREMGISRSMVRKHISYVLKRLHKKAEVYLC